MIAGGEAEERLVDERRRARVDLAAAHRLAVRYDMHESIENHLTLMVPGTDDRFYLNPFGLHWSEITASNLLEVNFDGCVHTGDGTPERSAVCIHGPIHRLVPGARCILHTHMPYAAALCQLQDMTLELIGQSALLLFGQVAYDYNYSGLALEPAEGMRLAQAMATKPVLMMQNHGVIVTGASVAEAFHRLYFLERACRVQLYAMWTGRERAHLSHSAGEAILEALREDGEESGLGDALAAIAELHFAASRRLLDRSEPDYAN